MQPAYSQNGSYLVAWEFRVWPGMERQFEQAYGQDGVWVRFFSRSPDYFATQLIRDEDDSLRYFTLDLWTSQAAYEAFRQEHRDQYAAIDRQCEKMTETELEIGRFEIVR